MAGVNSVSDSEEPVKAASTTKGKPVQGDPESEEEEEATEYEIEQVLDAKRGYFPDGRMGYFVKWKGYGSEENSWVDEQDALNAGDLVEEYWAKNPKKKAAAARKSLDKKSPKKPRKSVAAEDSSDAGNASTKKRGRKPSTKTFVESDEMDVDEISVTRAPKKARKAPKVTKTKTATPEPEAKMIGTMESYLHMNEWDGLVKSVDTVERADDNNLIVYFTLQSGEAVMAPSKICNQRFPDKMLDFYESNLRWRSVEDKHSP